MNVIVSNLNSDKFSNLDIDVIKSINGEFSADEIVQTFSNFFFNRMFLDITAVQNYSDVSVFKKISVGLDISKVILYIGTDEVGNDSNYISRLISMGIYNFAKDESELKYLYDNPNSYKDVAHLQLIDSNNYNPVVDNPVVNNSSNISSNSVKIIGFKNVTWHAGATSLIYMLKKQLSRDYAVIAIEVNKNDFMFFKDEEMISCDIKQLSNYVLEYKDKDIILVDLNDGVLGEGLCTDIIYLMESSTLMINKLYMLNNRCFENLMGKNVVLNKSLLNDNDIKLLEKESGLKFYSVVPFLNDRLSNNQELFPLLERLGLYRKM